MSTTEYSNRAAICLGVLVLLLMAGARAQVAVEAIEVGRERIVESVPLTGSVSALQLSSLSAEVSGVVARVHVQAGDRVAQGEPLVVLDRELSQLSLQAAEARLMRAQAQKSEAERRLNEAKDLVRDNNIAASEVDIRAAAFKSAQADWQVAQAERALAAVSLEKHTLYAPFAGSISDRLVSVGEWVVPGTALVELVSTEQLRVDFQVPQRYFDRVGEHTRLLLTLDSAPESRLAASDLRKVPLSRAGARTFLLRAALPDEVPEPIAGMAVSASLQLDAGREAVTVPRDALLRYPDGRISVWVADSANFGGEVSVAERQVDTGLTFDGRVEVARGLEAGEVVITRGNEALQQGQVVQLRRAGRSD